MDIDKKLMEEAIESAENGENAFILNIITSPGAIQRFCGKPLESLEHPPFLDDLYNYIKLNLGDSRQHVFILHYDPEGILEVIECKKVPTQ